MKSKKKSRKGKMKKGEFYKQFDEPTEPDWELEEEYDFRDWDFDLEDGEEVE